MIDTIRFHRRSVFVALLTLIATLLLAGCGDPKKDARQELSKMNVEYTADAFDKAIDETQDAEIKAELEKSRSLVIQSKKAYLKAANRLRHIF